MRAIQVLLTIVLGVPLAAAGIILIAWSLLAVWGMQGAFETAVAVADNWPYPLWVPPAETATAAMEPLMAGFIGIMGLVSYLIGAGILRTAFEGRIRVLKKSEQGEMFNLLLRCGRTYTPQVSDTANRSPRFHASIARW